VISGFRCEVDEKFTLLVYYAARSKMAPIGCPETSLRNYHYWLRNNAEERSSQK